MRKLADVVAANTTGAAKNAYDRVTTELLAAEGRRSVKRKVRSVGKVARKALKRGAAAGALVATAVVMREIKKRRAM